MKFIIALMITCCSVEPEPEVDCLLPPCDNPTEWDSFAARCQEPDTCEFYQCPGRETLIEVCS